LCVFVTLCEYRVSSRALTLGRSPCQIISQWLAPHDSRMINFVSNTIVTLIISACASLLSQLYFDLMASSIFQQGNGISLNNGAIKLNLDDSSIHSVRIIDMDVIVCFIISIGKFVA